MNKLVLVAPILIAVVAGGYYAYASGILNYQAPQAQTQQTVEEEAAQGTQATETAVVEETPEEIPEEPKAAGTPITGRSFTVEEAKAAPRICEQDSDCKIIPITCNQCDCGRPVNAWTEPYQCTEADKANPCGFVCPESKAVCNAGVCEKVEL